MTQFSTIEEIQFAICMQTISVRAIQQQFFDGNENIRKSIVRQKIALENELDDMIALYTARMGKVAVENLAEANF
jgi:hypothetical protein